MPFSFPVCSALFEISQQTSSSSISVRGGSSFLLRVDGRIPTGMNLLVLLLLVVVATFSSVLETVHVFTLSLSFF